MQNQQNDFERKIRELTQEINGQYPRPWMITPFVRDPSKTEVFIVGFNQRNAYDAQSTNYDEFIDSLFNRNGLECRSFYDKQTTKISPTRKTIDNFVDILKAEGISQILQTNVVCYSSPMSKDVTKNDHLAGEEIFKHLLRLIKPKVIIVHGAKASKQLSNILQTDLGQIPKSVSEIQCIKCIPE